MSRIRTCFHPGLALALLAACTSTIDPIDEVDPADPGYPEGTGGGAAAGEDNTFDHPDALPDIWELLERLKDEGPPTYAARVHACKKMRYDTVGALLTSRGVDTANNTALSAGRLYKDGRAALGAPNYGARLAEGSDLTTAGASKLYDIFAQAAPDLIAKMPLRAECAVGGVATEFFDAANHTNLASALAITPADLTRYGVNAATPTRLLDIAKTLITTAKAFAMGLTSSVVLPALRDDPHGAFNDMNNLTMTVTTLGKILDGFHGDLMSKDDPTCAGKKLGDSYVLTIHGDTPKNPLQRGGWPDGTPGNSNWVYVLGNGMLRSGWFGGIKRDGTVTGWDPTTGNDANVTSAATANPAAGAIAYAVARGDMRRVREFYRGADLGGVVRAVQM